MELLEQSPEESSGGVPRKISFKDARKIRKRNIWNNLQKNSWRNPWKEILEKSPERTLEEFLRGTPEFAQYFIIFFLEFPVRKPPAIPSEKSFSVIRVFFTITIQWLFAFLEIHQKFLRIILHFQFHLILQCCRPHYPRVILGNALASISGKSSCNESKNLLVIPFHAYSRNFFLGMLRYPYYGILRQSFTRNPTAYTGILLVVLF